MTSFMDIPKAAADLPAADEPAAAARGLPAGRDGPDGAAPLHPGAAAVGGGRRRRQVATKKHLQGVWKRNQGRYLVRSIPHCIYRSTRSETRLG